KATAHDAGFDLYAARGGLVGKYGPFPFSTGLRSVIPPGYYCQIVGRSGLGSRGVVVHGGVIDSSYRGEWLVILSSLGDTFTVTPGDRIAQFVVLPVPSVAIVEGPVGV